MIPPLQPPDIMHLQAAQGWLELCNLASAREVCERTLFPCSISPPDFHVWDCQVQDEKSNRALEEIVQARWNSHALTTSCCRPRLEVLRSVQMATALFYEVPIAERFQFFGRSYHKLAMSLAE